jgi:hypothetical protein
MPGARVRGTGTLLGLEMASVTVVVQEHPLPLIKGLCGEPQRRAFLGARVCYHGSIQGLRSSPQPLQG